MNVGIVGFGSIGTEVAKALIQGVENFYLYGITSRSKTNAEKRMSKLKKSINRHTVKIPKINIISETNLGIWATVLLNLSILI